MASVRDDVRRPGKLSDADRANFNTLLRAAAAGEIALVSAVRKADGKSVALVCAMQTAEDGLILPIPFAVMVEGDPFEDFEDPTR